MLKAFLAAAAIILPLSSIALGGPLRILALGDSITHGVDPYNNDDASSGGYRTHLANKLNAAGIAHTWIGRYTDGPPIAQRHEGWNGYTIRQIDNNIVADAFDASGIPDVILLMIGTNDAWNAPIYNDPLTTRERMLINLDALLHNIHNRAPNTHVVLSTIPPLGFEHPLAESARQVYNNGLDEMVHDLQGENFNIGLVNAGGLVPPELLPDLIHPGDAGYQLIAQGFYEAFVMTVPEPSSLELMIVLGLAGRGLTRAGRAVASGYSRHRH